MKNKILVIVILFLSYFVNSSTAQEAGFKRWSLKAVKASFDLPVSWSILENHGNEFVARDQSSPELLSLRVGPWKDSKLDAKGVANAGWNYKFERNNVEIPVKQRILVQESEPEDFNGFIASAIFGLVEVGGNNLYTMVIGLADPKSNDRIFMRFTWNRKNDDGKDKEKTKKSQEKNIELIQKIAKSVRNL